MAWNPFKTVGNVINKTADYLAGTSVGKTINRQFDTTALGANISSATPQPFLPPTPFSGAGQTGNQPAVVPTQQVTSGPYQNFTTNPAPKPTSTSSDC